MNESEFKRLVEFVWERFDRARAMHARQLFSRASDGGSEYRELSTAFAQRWARHHFVDGLYGVRPRFQDPVENRRQDFVDGIYTDTGDWIGWDAPPSIAHATVTRTLSGITFGLEFRFADLWNDVFSEKENEQTLGEMTLVASTEALDHAGSREAFRALSELIVEASGPPVIEQEQLRFWLSPMGRIELGYEHFAGVDEDGGQATSFRIRLDRPHFDAFAEDERLGARLREFARRLEEADPN